MKRLCKHCQQEKNIEEFANAGTLKGVNYKRHLCIQCYSKSKKPRKKQMKNWFVDFKRQCKCVKCGNDDYRVLDFDHLDRKEKSFDVGDCIRAGYSKQTILAEVAKCQVLCANCHRIKTFEERNEVLCANVLMNMENKNIDNVI